MNVNYFVDRGVANERLHTLPMTDKEDNDVKKSEPTNDYFFHILINAQLNGASALPYRLGLTNSDYQHLLTSLNSSSLISLDNQWQQNAPTVQIERSELLTQLMNIRLEERQDLITLLSSHKDIAQPLSEMAATVIATACLNSSHLWKSLAFNDRGELSQWITLNFPTLASANQQMRWKRFFYLQLCKQGGDYICRAPSCSECSSFDECFLPEAAQDGIK